LWLLLVLATAGGVATREGRETAMPKNQAPTARFQGLGRSMWAVWAGDGPTEDEEPVEDRRSSASFLRSLGGDDIDDLLNPKAAPALPPSLATNISTSRTPKKEASRYFSPAAPATGASRSESVHVCFLCGSPEHHAMRCPHEVCFQCLQTGHTSKECREGNPAAFLQHVRAITHRAHSRQLDVSQARCLRCGGLGHVDCSPDDGRPKNLSCFNCGGQGHTALGCKEDGMDRWHRRFAPLAAPAAAWGKGGGGGGRPGGGGKGGGRPSIAQIHASNRPGPPPERYRDRNSTTGGAGPYAGHGSNGCHGSNGRNGGSHSGSNGDRDGGGGGFRPPAHQGGGARGRDAGGFTRPQGIVKPTANSHTRFR
jgi:hypothetical protein